MPESRVVLSHAERAHLRRAASKYAPDRTAARRAVRYLCPHGHDFEVPFLAEPNVVVPEVFECRQHGIEADVVDDIDRRPKRPQKVRTHWDMLLERRSIPELEELLAEALASCRADHLGAR